jgi:hypothetical protein
LAIFFAKPPAHLYSGKILKNFNFISMKFKKIALLTVALASIQSLYAQKQADIDWQIGLNTVPLYERIVDGSVENPFLPTPTNLFLVKRINNQKNNALRFSADVRFRRERNDDEFTFQVPYQFKLGLLAGYEKRRKLTDKFDAMVGVQLNPVIVLNVSKYDYISLPTRDFTDNFKNTKYFQINLSGIGGIEYKINEILSLSIESGLFLSHEILDQNPPLQIRYEYQGNNTTIIIGSVNLRETKIDVRPVTFLNLNINIQ